MSGPFWISTWFLPPPISKLMAMKLLALGSWVNAALNLFVCTNLYISATWIKPHVLHIASMHVSVKHPNIIATLKVEGLEGACVYFNLNNRAAASIYGAVRKYYSPVAALGWGQSNGCLFSGRSCQHRRLRSPSCCQVTFNPEQIFCMCCSAVTCNPWVLGTDCQDKEMGFISVTATKQYPPLKGYFCS